MFKCIFCAILHLLSVRVRAIIVLTPYVRGMGGGFHFRGVAQAYHFQKLIHFPHRIYGSGGFNMTEKRNSKARIEANNRYNAKAYDRINIAVPRGVKVIAEVYAKGKNESINGLMNRLLMTELGATAEEWKRGEVSLPEPDKKPETPVEAIPQDEPSEGQRRLSESEDKWLEPYKRLATEEQERREEFLKREAANNEMRSVFHDDMSDSDE